MLQQTTLHFRRATLWAIALVLAMLSVVPALMPSFVSAAPVLTERELLSNTAVAGAANTLTWYFDTTATAANVDHIEIEFCDSPLGACTVPNGANNGAADNIPILSATPTATLGGPGGWAAPANTATRAATGDAGGTSNQILIDVTTPFAGASANEANITIAGFTNDNNVNVSFYTRMRVYSDAGVTLVWEGVYAQSTSQTLTVNARVQERLDFCVGSTIRDDATGAVPASCAAVTGTLVDIGNVENGFSNVSPVTVANGGTNENGIAMVRSNAVLGVVVDYKSLLETSSGALKTTGATCNAVPSTSGTDQCFNTSVTQGALVAGTENFGMTIAGINCNSVSAASYSCVFATGAYNLLRDAAYDGNGANTYVTDTNQVGGTTNGGYAWDATGTADRIASSAASANKVVDDEAMILKFAATAGITTPTGSYTVQADFIATATF